MRRWITGALGLGLALGLLGCQAGDKIDKIAQQQEEILEKLKTLEANQKRMLAAPTAARPQAPQEDFNKVYKIDVGSSPILGNPKAPVTVVEFSDFQCPYCAQASPLIKELQKKFPDKVKVVFKHFPLSFHAGARPAAIASMAAADQGKFWEFHDVLFSNSRELKPDNMEQWAEKAGLDVARFKQDMAAKAEAYGKAVDADFQHGQSVSVRGTPTLFINGKKVQNRSIEGMSAMVEEALKAGG